MRNYCSFITLAVSGNTAALFSCGEEASTSLSILTTLLHGVSSYDFILFQYTVTYTASAQAKNNSFFRVS